MSAPKHTPAPWVAAVNVNPLHSWTVYGGPPLKLGELTPIAELPDACSYVAECAMTEERVSANAYLIAAAPEMAAALSGYLAMVDSREPITPAHVKDITDAMRAALAKAGI
jgi:hypothetical protein